MTEPLLFATAMLAIALTADGWIDASAHDGRLAPGVGAGRRVPHALRGVADRGGDRRLAGVVLLRRGHAGRAIASRGARLAAYPAIAIVAVPRQQPVDRRRPGSSPAASSSPENTDALGTSAGRMGIKCVKACIELSGTVLWSGRRYAGAVLDRRSRRVRSRSARHSRTAARARRRCGAASRSRTPGPSVSHPLRRAARRRCAALAALESGCSGAAPTDRRRARRLAPRWSQAHAARSQRAAHRRITARRDQSRGRRAVTAYLVAALRRPNDHDEHGIARPLHARSVRSRVRHSRFPARRQRRHLEFARRADRRPSSGGSRSRSRPKAATRCISKRSATPRFLDGFMRVAEGGGVALYRRHP